MIRDDLFDRGVRQRETMFGRAGAQDQVNHTTELDDRMQEFVTRTCFGDIWQRDGLSIQDRSRITIAMMIATGKAHELRIHLRGGINNGLTPLELREIALHSILYCGIPAGVEGIRALEEILAEFGIDELSAPVDAPADENLAGGAIS